MKKTVIKKVMLGFMTDHKSKKATTSVCAVGGVHLFVIWLLG